MEDFSSLVWLGIVIIWFLARLVRRGARKAARTEQKRPQPKAPRPTAPPAEPRPARFGDEGRFIGRGGKGPPPIVPR